MPTSHDSTISMERIMLVYYIMEEIHVNVGEIISKHIIVGVKHPRGTRPFPQLIKKLCLKACSALDNLPQIGVKDGIWSSATLYRIIAINRNKAKLKYLKAKQDGKSEVKEVDDKDEEEKEEDNVPLKRKRQSEDESSK
ncbi:drebrin-like [Cucumis melo var. makuwa]|uniref:Drebrin-like n=1 Tax=Cucumis melo var. makuwa TaxID=1194695 RepID=A0A5A7UWQ4_CUCMM|nr:drebrin-like [Cucumis melo var. makuwa]